MKKMKNTEKSMEKIVAFCKNRGYVFAGSEIYGGLANTWDYGPLGVELKNNVKKAWWKKFVQENPYNVGLDAAILMNPQTWVASGHLGGFSDPLMDCRECHERFRADKIIEDWCAENNFELGSSLIGALSFYGVGSPFFWLTLLFPNVSYPIIAPCMLALKLAVAGTGAYCYIRQYTKECKWALVASMLYAFSGYQIFNINFHFQDALAFFPFLLLALDINVKKDKKGWFAVTVALMAFTNYFFLAQIIVFLVIYFVVKLWTKEYSLNTKLFVQLAIESILGVSSAMVLLLPTVLFMAGNPRLSQSIFTVETLKLFFYKPYRYADLLRAVLLPFFNPSNV